MTDCSGQVWRYDYDNEGRLVASSDPLGQLTRRRYDPLGQLIGLELADGSALSYEYDALGRQTRIADAEGHATLFSWGTAICWRGFPTPAAANCPTCTTKPAGWSP